MNKVAVPKVGMRIVKTVVAVFICFLIDVFRTGGIPCYSAIAAILCMQPDVSHSFKIAGDRVVGTLIGGLYGMLLLSFLQQVIPADWLILEYAIIALALIPLIYIMVLIKNRDATYITCVVFLCVTVSHGHEVGAYLFAINRIIDTLIGIFVSLIVNFTFFCRKQYQFEKEAAELAAKNATKKKSGDVA